MEAAGREDVRLTLSSVSAVSEMINVDDCFVCGDYGDRKNLREGVHVV